ncbi:glutamyl-Q tRNA(Asp) synthetase [Mycobacteroides abscessus subsp. abscessus]|nr:glutamyl-Q tRNA(Asp) synthetase [Mycobacteroides abscessus subsp. abscessus]
MMHVPVVTNSEGQKLSKQTGAAALDPGDALANLQAAGRHLGLGDVMGRDVTQWLLAATTAWARRWVGAE